MYKKIFASLLCLLTLISCAPKKFEPQYVQNVLLGREDWLFFIEDYAENYYFGDNVLSEEEMKTWADTYTKLDDLLKEKGARLGVLILPNKEILYEEYMPDYDVEINTTRRTDVFAQYMKEHTDVAFCYPLNEFREVKKDYEIYHKQDTHWNDVGAFVGMMAMYKTFGLQTIPISDIDIIEKEKTGGDVDYAVETPSTYVDYDIQYKPEIVSEGTWIDYTSAIEYQTENAQYNSVIVLADSFKDNIFDIVSKDFKHSIITHRIDLLKGIDSHTYWAIKNMSEGDILLLMTVERHDHENIDIANKVIEILTDGIY